MEQIVLIFQIFFYISGICGVLLATVNHYWFVRDRNLSNIFQITEFLQSNYLEFQEEIDAENDIKFPYMKIMNALLMYCTLHNGNQIRPSTKKIHEAFVASMLEDLFGNEILKRRIFTNKGDLYNYDVFRKFIKNNSKLFVDDSSLLKEIDKKVELTTMHTGFH